MYPDCAETGSVSIVSSTRCNDDTEINKTSKKTYTQLNEVQLAAFCFIYKLVRMVGSFLLVSILSSPTLFFFLLVSDLVRISLANFTCKLAVVVRVFNILRDYIFP